MNDKAYGRRETLELQLCFLTVLPQITLQIYTKKGLCQENELIIYVSSSLFSVLLWPKSTLYSITMKPSSHPYGLLQRETYLLFCAVTTSPSHTLPTSVFIPLTCLSHSSLYLGVSLKQRICLCTFLHACVHAQESNLNYEIYSSCNLETYSRRKRNSYGVYMSKPVSCICEGMQKLVIQ